MTIFIWHADIYLFVDPFVFIDRSLPDRNKMKGIWTKSNKQ